MPLNDQGRMKPFLYLQILDYNLLSGMRREAIEKLNRIQPINLGQAGRIAGISRYNRFNKSIYA